MEKIKLYFLRLNQIKNRLEEMLSVLSDEEKAKAERFVREEDRLLSVGGAYLARRFFGRSAAIARSPSGKPFTGGGFFSISHSVDTVAAAFCRTREVGMDMEKHRSGYGELAKVCFSAAESQSGRGFFDLFTAKESLAKAEGGGIAEGLALIPALPLDGEVVYKGQKYIRHSFAKCGYSVSVCLQSEDFTIEECSVYES